MKRLLGAMLIILFLTGCAGKSEMERGMTVRNRLLEGEGCQFNATVTADYGDELYEFSMSCKTDQAGTLTFTVIAPDSLVGITGFVDSTGGKLTFDDQALAFPALAEGLLTPVSAPWVFVTALRGGYLKACDDSKDGLHMIVNDSYAQDAIQIDIFTDSQLNPIRAEILWKGMRIVTLRIEGYVVL